MAKMLSGYVVRLAGFVKVDSRDFDAHAKVIAAVQAAQAGKPADLLAMLDIDALDVKAATRRGKAAVQQPALGLGTVGGEP